ncbi:MAG: HAD-IA family hydrolase [Oleiphilaceae bacterium]|nr:HAD-IA family hydrolase [Oleiphilaceae bacterium]
MTGAALFDLDGTLVDTAPDFIVVLNAQRMAHGQEPLPEQAIRDTVSDGARALIRLAFGGEPGEPRFEQLRQELLDRYEDEVGKAATLFDGFDEVLRELEQRHIPWGIVTNKPRLYTELLLERMGLQARCAVTICPDDVAQSKPDPEGLLLACRHLSCNPRQSIYLGDHERDIAAGRAAAMRTIAARYGYIADKRNVSTWQADHIIDHGSECRPLFDAHLFR